MKYSIHRGLGELKTLEKKNINPTKTDSLRTILSPFRNII